jgi:tetratricopeptide (TPR) repeat protein
MAAAKKAEEESTGLRSSAARPLPIGVGADARPQRRDAPSEAPAPPPRPRPAMFEPTPMIRPVSARPAAEARVPPPRPAPSSPPAPSRLQPQHDVQQTPAHVLPPRVAAEEADDPFDFADAHPRLRAIPPPGRRPIAANAGRGRHWPYLLSGLLCGAVLICGATAAALFWLPREDLAGVQSLLAGIASVAAPPSTTSPPAAADKPEAAPAAPVTPPKPQVDPKALATLNTERADFQKQTTDLESRGAAVWGGADFAAAQMQAAEANGAAAAGGVTIALQHMDQAKQLLGNVAQRAPQALAAQLKAGDAAIAAGHRDVASQAYAIALRIDPNSRRAIEGSRRARLLSGVLPLLEDARKAEAANNYSRAAQDFSQALALDPGNDAAKSGLARANAAFGNDSYARSVGAGFAALGAGRLTEAQTDFQQALNYRAQGKEATEGLQRVSAAMEMSRIASLRQQAAELEAQEHWRQAIAVYDTALRLDPALAFAKQGKARDEGRAELAESLQEIIDHPARLSYPSVKDEAVNLLQEAREQAHMGPALQAQVERLAQLLPQLDRPVLLSLISDNSTQVSIPSIGVLGSFGKREIHLKPGTYTVVGTRDGYRAVHQEFTVEPGQQMVSITVTCSEPI